MKEKAKILFYCQHSLGMGHLVRSFALAEELSTPFQVIFLNGGRLPERLQVPANIEIINLPPLGFDGNNQLVSLDENRTVDECQTIRERLILNIFKNEKPSAIIIELFPFGRKKFQNELLPLLKMAKGKAKILCSLRDILVGQRRDQARHEERAVTIANKFFDAILVHSDKDFARLEETFQPATPLQIPVYYTGFVAKTDVLDFSAKNKNQVIVSAGGGMVGENLLQTAIEAKDLLPENIQLKLIAGAFLPEESFEKLQTSANQKSNIELTRFVPNLAQEMGNSAVSVSQCGYNTAMDILRSGVASVVVPFADNGDDEQMKRARRLEKMDVLQVLEKSELSPNSLAEAIKKAFDFEPKAGSLDLKGGENSARIIEDLLTEDSWLEPVRKALSERKTPLNLFFRDDDAGWEDTKLFKLIELFKQNKMPLDLAAIPCEMNESLARKIRLEINENPRLLAVHQHGFVHKNHEETGRKCEFGASRSYKEQFIDIATGKRMLESYFGGNLTKTFTPPWNRCTEETAKVLRELGFSVLSRESGAKLFNLNGLKEVSVTFDWFAKRKGVPFSRTEIGEMLAKQIAENETVGIMLHHGVMDEKDFVFLSELLALLRESQVVQPCLISDLVSIKKLTAQLA